PNDPVFEAKRNQVVDPFWDADMPYMLLRLKQGVGRLIRSHNDKGLITIFMPKSTDSKVRSIIEQNVPTKIENV
ncbi:helicase C-terminal domain-containing protein, partial [Priestia megaterium]